MQDCVGELGLCEPACARSVVLWDDGMHVLSVYMVVCVRAHLPSNRPEWSIVLGVEAV